MKMFFACVLFLQPATALYEERESQGVRYGLLRAQASQLRLYWRDENGRPFRYLGRLRQHLQRQNQDFLMLMNAGIYDLEERPAGLWIENGQELRPLNTRSGAGNFHIQPNGVFYVQDGQAGLLPTAEYQKRKLRPQWALQSGPMLLQQGKINPRFKADGGRAYRRNALCLLADGELLLAMTLSREQAWPNLHQLAAALQAFGCREALYLDGSISSWHLPPQYGDFHWSPFAGMLAIFPAEALP